MKIYIAVLAVFVLIVSVLPVQSQDKIPLSELLGKEKHARKHHSILVYSETAGFRHASISAGIAAIQLLGTQNGFTVDATENSADFNDANLAQYGAVVFLNTTGDVLNTTEQTAFENFIRSGGGYVGIHSAADTEYDWAWYGDLVGAYFQSHPAIQEATIKVADIVHPSTETLPRRWTRTDEWYNYQANPRGDVHVLATLDENTYTGGEDGFDHPISWCHNYDGGRSWYTGLGHTSDTFSEPLFLDHLLGGILWAAGDVEGDAGATVEANFEKVILDDNTNNPMELAVANDGRVFYVERAGALKVYDPNSSATNTIGNISVNTANEDGLLGIALDPDFDNNSHIFMFYSPSGTNAVQHVSRFTLVDNSLDLSSEVIVLVIPTQREQCCHSGGSLAFDADGNLFISTGDNTNPFESSGYTPIDERSGRSPWDAQKSSGNRNDLRGKVLRITPQPDGSYTIPAGNLFPADGSNGAPEVFVMGTRNPFRISVDAETGWLYWGDVGPDAGGDSGTRGPRGYDEWNQAREAGNYGWPYFVADNKAYNDYDFATSTSGSVFDPNNVINDSPNNTGDTVLPNALPAWIWYPYGESAEFPEITNGGGRTSMAGPVYQYDSLNTSENQLPEYYDKTLFIYEWSRNWIKEVKLDENGDLLKINDFVPHLSFLRPMDMEIGPDGAIYMLEWGTGFGGGNTDSKLVRIDYISGSRSPVAIASATPSSGPVPLTVDFSSEESFDPDVGEVLTYEWDFESDSTIDSNDPNPQFTYTTAGNYTAQLTITDEAGNQGITNVLITAGNTAPELTIHYPLNGGFYNWNETIAFDVSVTDFEDGSTEDGTIDCDTVFFQPFIGHDDHAHPLENFTGCEGEFVVAAGHGNEGDNLFYVVEGRYTDEGASEVGSLSAIVDYILQPKVKQAEHYTTESGVIPETTGDVLGGVTNLGFLDHDDYISISPVNLENIGYVSYRVASAGTGGRIEVRVGSADGELISTAHVDITGGWQTYRTIITPITNPGGTNDLFFVFKNQPGNSGLFNLNWIEFHGAGMATLPEGAPDGLKATYYDDLDFGGDTLTRIDPMIAFNWNNTAPDPSMNPNRWSSRWTGQFVTEHSEDYTFYVRADDGVRLWINNELVIDEWNDQGVTEFSSAPIALVAGQSYDIQMEHYDNSLQAQAHLLWSSASTVKQTIPQSQLYSEAGPVGIADDDNGNLPQEITLYHAYPNPFNPTTKIRYYLPKTSEVELTVFDVLGRQVKRLVDERQTPGFHNVEFDAAGVSSGTYFYRLKADGRILTKRMTLMK